ncbi:phosphoribosyl-ATP pyrophosphatase [Panacagrimonas perspica]|uniref:Phosphoribosyl-ATP pyrophosphatase n=1 Tax=Panacagrimonas perspica TaxID=381431 RepID=A0A4S3K5Q4_9GAMM|nr:phosphoribosyl-ATP diphosphatase [Panacagrimonas perspica]TDU28040.1 phosphoribosyl-ATP pyrophosphatase [Panacagrimonas perspica]THD03460.1 phosphoribosyl-ATP diphosphatase [Panacagrimonas perspica]
MSESKDLGAALDELYATLLERKTADPAKSYAASLYEKGLDTILKKIGEESAETLIAAKNGSRSELVYETVDLLYHLFVLMAREGIQPADLAVELQRRAGRSGLEEKAVRVK